MKYTLLVKEEAAQETIEAAVWYQSRSNRLGETFLNELENCYNRIVQNPEAFQKKYKEFRHAQLKRFPFLVLFEIVKEKIAVIKN